jgi:putative metallohydrolase (TIGR04338 family)
MESIKLYSDKELQAYEDYVERRQSLIRNFENKGRAKSGRSPSRVDSGKGKVYHAEHVFYLNNSTKIQHFESYDEIRAFVDRVTASKTWEKVCNHNRPYVQVKMRHAQATWSYANTGVIAIAPKSYHMNAWVVLHELAHVAGFMHHDLGFRLAELKLISRFIGPWAAKELKKQFRRQKLRMSKPSNKIQSMEEWIIGYRRMAKARAARSSSPVNGLGIA